MKDKLLVTVMRIVELLESCGERTRAEWFRERLGIVRAVSSDSEKFQEAIRELQNVLSGMGSLSDLSLNPTPSCGLTRQEARNRQWELVEELDDAIQDVLADLE